MSREHTKRKTQAKEGIGDSQIKKQQISDQPYHHKEPDIPLPPAIYPVLAISSGYFLQRFAPLPQPAHASFLIVGSVFFVVGIVLIGWSIITLRKFNTTILPHQPAKHLISTGPFRFSRNPIYLAFLLLALASAVSTGNLWTLLMLPIIMMLLSCYAIRPEEIHLQLTFADDYEVYFREVRRWL